MRFEFATATRIIFGRGTAREIPALCREYGGRVLLVTGRDAERTNPIRRDMAAAGLAITDFSIAAEPTVADVEAGAACAQGCDLVIAIGGGSAIDAGKAIAAMAAQSGPLLDYLEVIGGGKPLQARPLPFIAVPTTAGTGAEVTRNAVLSSPEHQVKVSLRHAWMLPAVALIDPELARGCPPAVTAASGMDALTQCIEAFVSCRAQPMTDALCIEGIRRAVRSLERAVNNGDDLEAREDLALAALFSGMALANAGLGAVHGFAAPIGGRFHAPHGAVCAALLAPVWKANWEVVAAEKDAALEQKFRQAASLLTGQADAAPQMATQFLEELTQRLRIPGLGTYGITTADIDDIASRAAQASSMKGNPVTLGPEDLWRILREALA
jgi:alcohol dehydrogenase class IV